MRAYGDYSDDGDHGEDAGYGDHGGYEDRPVAQPQVALIDLLDRLLSGGVVLTGDLVLAVADIDLVRVSLRAVIVSIREQMDEQWAPVLPGPAAPELPGRAFGRGFDHGDERPV